MDRLHSHFPQLDPETARWFLDLLAEFHVDLPSVKAIWENDGWDLRRNRLLRQEDGEKPRLRWDHQLILELVPAGSRVLDCGCGDGDLLLEMTVSKGIIGQGLEIDPEAVTCALTRGVSVIQADLDIGLEGFGNNTFDYTILEKTLQTVHKPMEVLREMLRVAKIAIVSFPNFSHWRNRLQLFLTGRMPQTIDVPYAWYDTPNIHHLTIDDFVELVESMHCVILGGYAREGTIIHPLRDSDRLLAEEALFVISRAENS